MFVIKFWRSQNKYHHEEYLAVTQYRILFWKSGDTLNTNVSQIDFYDWNLKQNERLTEDNLGQVTWLHNADYVPQHLEQESHEFPKPAQAKHMSLENHVIKKKIKFKYRATEKQREGTGRVKPSWKQIL